MYDFRELKAESLPYIFGDLKSFPHFTFALNSPFLNPLLLSPFATSLSNFQYATINHLASNQVQVPQVPNATS